MGNPTLGHSHSFEKWTTEPQEGPSKPGVFYDCPDGFGPLLYDVAETEEDVGRLTTEAKRIASVVWTSPVWSVSTVKGFVGHHSALKLEYNNGPVDWKPTTVGGEFQWIDEPTLVCTEGFIAIPHGGNHG